VSNYFWQRWNSWVEVTQTQYSDLEGLVETTDDSETVLIKCVVQMTKSIGEESSIQVTPLTLKGDQSVSVTLPADAAAEYGPYDLPFDGYFRVEIPSIDQTGFYYTENLHYTASEWTIYYAIITSAPEWKDKIDIQLLNWAQYYDRKELYVYFNGYNGDPADWNLVDADLFEVDFTGEELNGPSTWDSLAKNFTSSTLKAYDGSVIIYAPVPHDMLVTHHSLPQIHATIDGFPAACARVDCSYQYVSPVGLVESFEILNYGVVNIGDVVVVSITGQNLDQQLNTIHIFDQHCSSFSDDEFPASDTLIHCHIEARVAGTYLPVIFAVNGIIPIDSSLVPMDIELTITSVND